MAFICHLYFEKEPGVTLTSHCRNIVLSIDKTPHKNSILQVKHPLIWISDFKMGFLLTHYKLLKLYKFARRTTERYSDQHYQSLLHLKRGQALILELFRKIPIMMHRLTKGLTLKNQPWTVFRHSLT